MCSVGTGHESKNSSMHLLCKTLKTAVGCSGGYGTPNVHRRSQQKNKEQIILHTAIGTVTADNGSRKDAEDEPHSKHSQEGVHNEKYKHY